MKEFLEASLRITLEHSASQQAWWKQRLCPGLETSPSFTFTKKKHTEHDRTAKHDTHPGYPRTVSCEQCISTHVQTLEHLQQALHTKRSQDALKHKGTIVSLCKRKGTKERAHHCQGPSCYCTAFSRECEHSMMNGQPADNTIDTYTCHTDHTVTPMFLLSSWILVCKHVLANDHTYS